MLGKASRSFAALMKFCVLVSGGKVVNITVDHDDPKRAATSNYCASLIGRSLESAMSQERRVRGNVYYSNMSDSRDGYTGKVKKAQRNENYVHSSL